MTSELPSSIAFYVHFPFCLSICPYCDFDRQSHGFDRIDAYLEQVIREIRTFADERRPVHSVFFGGGTPSLMTPGQVDSLLGAIRETVTLTADAEITLESNPGDADLEKMRAFRTAGVNRLSFGVQSLDDAVLEHLGRRHSAAEARQAAVWARDAGFAFNLDFMYGLAGQTLDHWEQTVRQAIALQPDHLSCYALTLESHVPMGRQLARGRISLPEDDSVADMYDVARNMLGDAGFSQYEISNWAQPGQASRHNLTYWRDGEWLAAGVGAAGTHRGRRWKNTPSLERYIRSMRETGTAIRVEEETPNLSIRIFDRVTLGLRLREGLSMAAFLHDFGSDVWTVLGEQGGWMREAGLLEFTDDPDRVRVPADKQLILNNLLARLRDPIVAWSARAE